MSEYPITITGLFSETWDTNRALEDLSTAGFGSRLRHVVQDASGPGDDTKDKGGINLFLAKVYGFVDEDDSVDSKNNWSVSPEAEEYLTDAYHRQYHVIIIKVESDEERSKAIDILAQHNANVDEKIRFVPENDHPAQTVRTESGYPQPPVYHPTQLIEPSLDPLSI